MPTNVDAGQFRNLVFEHYGFLSDDYGYSIARKGDFAYEMESGHGRIRIFIEYSTLVTDIEPVGESANQLLRRNLVPKRVGVTVVCEYLDPQLHYEVAMLDAKNLIQDISLELEKRATLLKAYCGELLRGDFSVWPSLMAYLSNRHKRK